MLEMLHIGIRATVALPHFPYFTSLSMDSRYHAILVFHILVNSRHRYSLPSSSYSRSYLARSPFSHRTLFHIRTYSSVLSFSRHLYKDMSTYLTRITVTLSLLFDHSPFGHEYNIRT
jgi:hypothetical protein